MSLLVGNFDPASAVGFGGTDFFYTTSRLDGNCQWWHFYYRASPPNMGDAQLAYDSTPPDQLRFSDFNGDGVTDVFELVQRYTIDLPAVLL